MGMRPILLETRHNLRNLFPKVIFPIGNLASLFRPCFIDRHQLGESVLHLWKESRLRSAFDYEEEWGDPDYELVGHNGE